MSKDSMTIENVRELHRTGHLEEAKRGYLGILKANPNSAPAHHLLGILFAEEGDVEQAQIHLEKAIELAPDEPAYALHLANILKIRGLFDRAVEILLNVTQNHPNYAAGFNNLGTIYYSQSKMRQAIEAYQFAIDIQPDYVDAYYNLGLAWSKLNRREEAMNAFQAVVDLSPHHAGALFQLGCLSMQQQKYQDAIKNFVVITNQHPFHFESQTNLATCYLRLGRLDDAKKHYEKALEINATDLQVLFNLGVINMQQGQIEDAIQYYLKAVEINPDSYEAHNNLAFTFLTMRNHPKALEHFNEALRIEPKNTSIRHTIHILTGDKEISGSPPEYIRALFDSYADHFDAHLTQSLHYRVPDIMHQVLSELTELPHSSWNILDLGCGTGLSGAVFRSYAKTLTGIDLSSKMLDVAAKKNLYDSLIQTDIHPFLQTKKADYDLILAADVLVYFGDLREVLHAIYQALKPGGFLIFNTEIGSEEHYRLSKTGRFVHNKSYLDKVATENQFKIVRYQEIPMRTQEKKPISGHLYVLQKAL